jgi:hypothetical protein
VKAQLGPLMILGKAATTQVRLIVWCKDCGHQVEPDPGVFLRDPLYIAHFRNPHGFWTPFGLLRGRSNAQNCWVLGYLGFPMVIVRGLKAHGKLSNGFRCRETRTPCFSGDRSGEHRHPYEPPTISDQSG